MFLNSYNIIRDINTQPQTVNLRIVMGKGGFTVAWLFFSMFENPSEKECVANGFPYLEILKGWLKDSIFTRQHKMVHRLQLQCLLFNQKCTF